MYSVITESNYMAQYQAAHNNTIQLRKPVYDNISAVKIAKLTAAKWLGVAKETTHNSGMSGILLPGLPR